MTSKRSSGIQVRIRSTFIPFLAALTVLIAFAVPARQAGTNQPPAKSSAAPVPTQAGMPRQAVRLLSPGASDAAQPNFVSFLPAVTYDSGGQGAMSAAVADVNGDGKPDLVVPNACPISGCSNSEPIGVLFGNGDGTFQPAVTYGSGGVSAYSIGSVAIADVNGDGRPDLVVTNACGVDSNCKAGSVGVLLGIGDGTFAPAVTYGSGGYFDRSVVLADVNGDRKLDILVSNNCADINCGGDGVVGVLLGNGDGTFQTAVTYSSGGTIAEWVAVSDVNGDGKPDLIMANGDGSVGILLGNGDGTFQIAVPYQAGGYHKSLAVADLNGDSRPDIVVPSYSSNTVEVLLGNGDGTFQAGVSYGSGGINARSVATADVNNDGVPDLLVANECVDFNCLTGTVAVLLGSGDGTYQTAIGYGSGGYFAQSVAVADVNGDGSPDLLVANFSVDFFLGTPGAVDVLLNNTKALSPTNTTLTSSQSHSFYGQPVTFTATVTTSGPIAPTGTVNFRSGSHGIGTGTLDASGVATFTTSLLKPGLYRITALYNGDASNLHSISAVLYQAVKQK